MECRKQECHCENCLPVRVTILKDLAVDHDYYCHTNNYYSNDAHMSFETWKDFHAEFVEGGIDVDMNLVFRWDIRLSEETGMYNMEVFIIHQRKGIFRPITIQEVIEENVPEVIAYLELHKAKIDSIWKPL